MARITSKERREIERRRKQREVRLRRKYPKVHGKAVDFITHSIDDGTLYFTVRFNDQTKLCRVLETAHVILETDLGDWKTENFKQLAVSVENE
jgi:hypothetical protein